MFYCRANERSEKYLLHFSENSTISGQYRVFKLHFSIFSVLKNFEGNYPIYSIVNHGFIKKNPVPVIAPDSMVQFITFISPEFSLCSRSH
jgi:hypothetical protein